jgi:hypothetical protein
VRTLLPADYLIPTLLQALVHERNIHLVGLRSAEEPTQEPCGCAAGGTNGRAAPCRSHHSPTDRSGCRTEGSTSDRISGNFTTLTLVRA